MASISSMRTGREEEVDLGAREFTLFNSRPAAQHITLLCNVVELFWG
jgi:hypothetical protein